MILEFQNSTFHSQDLLGLLDPQKVFNLLLQVVHRFSRGQVEDGRGGGELDSGLKLHFHRQLLKIVHVGSKFEKKKLRKNVRNDKFRENGDWRDKVD